MKKKYGQLIKAEFKTTSVVLTVILAGIMLSLAGLAINCVFPFNIYSAILYEIGIDSFAYSVSGVMSVGGPVFIICSAVLAACQNHSRDGGRINEFIETLPYTRRQRFFVKYFYGVGSLTLLLGIGIAGTLLLMLLSRSGFDSVYKLSPFYSVLKANDNIPIILLMFFAVWISAAAVYTLCMLMNSFINNNVAASITGTLILMLPQFVAERIDAVMANMGKVSHIVPDSFNILDINAVDAEAEYVTRAGIVCFEDRAFICMLILGAIIVVGFILNMIMAGRYELADAGYIISKKYVRYIIIAIIGLLGGLVVISGRGIRNMEPAGMIAAGVISGMFIAYIAGKIIRIGDRH